MPDPVLGPVTTTDVYRVTFVQRLYGQRVLNVLHYKPTSVPDPAPDRWTLMGSLADAMTGAGSIMALMQAMQSIDLGWEAIRVSVFNGDTVTRFPYFQLAAIDSGVDVAPSGTANIAMSIEKRATFEPDRPRTGIGRFQLGGIPNDVYAEGEFLDPYMVLGQALADELTEGITTAGVDLAPGLWNETDSVYTFNFIFGAAPKRTVRDMRRRTVAVGE